MFIAGVRMFIVIVVNVYGLEVKMKGFLYLILLILLFNIFGNLFSFFMRFLF